MMTIFALAVALLAQGAPADELPVLQCALTTPAGDTVRFSVPAWDEEGDEIHLVRGQESVWPTQTLPGVRNIMTGSERAGRMFAFGSGNGVALEIGEAVAENSSSRPTTLFRRDGQRVGLPLAHGFCAPPRERRVLVYRMIDANFDPREIGATIPAFDPAGWPERDCGMILDDGRQVRFSFNLTAPDRARLAGSGLWGGQPVSLPIRWQDREDGLQFGTFGRRGGPNGSQTMYIEQDSGNAVKLIHLTSLGDAASNSQSGYAICGYRRIVRRPNVR